MEADQITAWISEERFAPFLERAGGDWALAVELYLWHARVAGASLTTLHHFEVALRNAIDRQLGAGEPDIPVEGAWLLDPATLSQPAIGKVRRVLGRLEQEGYPRERRRVVASLPFSFWKGLFVRRYEGLWRTRLRHAFPGAGLRREILEPLTNLHLWRNRIAHHDSLLHQNLERRLAEMIGVSNAIDPSCGDWLTACTEMTALLEQRPEASAEAMRGGWFHSGDIARTDEDGYFYIVDRKKDLIIRGGYNVYPREVEEVLYEHPKIREAAVIEASLIDGS